MEGSDRTQLDGMLEVAAAALDGGVGTVAGMHGAIARTSFAPLRLVPGLAEVSGAVQEIHDGIARLVYGGVRAAVAVASGAARTGAALVGSRSRDASLGPRAGAAVAALNGFAGDRLARAANPLAATMALRHGGRPVAPERRALAAAFPRAGSRVAVFVHGLAGDESWWRMHAERHYGDPHATYGSRLEADLAYTPLYVRYNSGLHVSDNGRRLARLLDAVVAAWPIAVEELVLVGHSMGGLVARSACASAQAAGASWVRCVRHVVFLGSPHHGAPLEKVANVAAWLLRAIPVTRPLADVVNQRSVGIKDLRFGALRDEDWQDVDLDALLTGRAGHVPLLPAARHYFVAATVTRDLRHPLGAVLGDLLVREPSASGARVRRSVFPLDHWRHFGPMTHFELLNHPEVYAQLREWLAPGGAPSTD